MTVPLTEIRAHRSYVQCVFARVAAPERVILEVETCDGNRFTVSDDQGERLVYGSLQEASEQIWDLGRVKVIEGDAEPGEG
ncbi:hypothetical protein [Marinobacterium jannaschii]|uniref:hypothetical protein n=1 Tax=Marinobacterium jannaschii TaxID=64970 RepID=UPI000483210B|nr:hypothetical protein [Marinobacterium jannaschii]